MVIAANGEGRMALLLMFLAMESIMLLRQRFAQPRVVEAKPIVTLRHAPPSRSLMQLGGKPDVGGLYNGTAVSELEDSAGAETEDNTRLEDHHGLRAQMARAIHATTRPFASGNSTYPASVSAYFRGSWRVASNDTPTIPTFQNSAGDIMYVLSSTEEKESPPWQSVKGKMVVRDGGLESEHSAEWALKGVYNPESGMLSLFLQDAEDTPEVPSPSSQTQGDTAAAAQRGPASAGAVGSAAAPQSVLEKYWARHRIARNCAADSTDPKCKELTSTSASSSSTSSSSPSSSSSSTSATPPSPSESSTSAATAAAAAAAEAPAGPVTASSGSKRAQATSTTTSCPDLRVTFQMNPLTPDPPTNPQSTRPDTTSESVEGAAAADGEAAAASEDSKSKAVQPLNENDSLGMSGNITSRDCGFSLTVDASVWRFDLFYNKTVHYVSMVAVISIFQIALIIHQMRDANSPARAGKISLLCIGEQALVDSYLCLLHLTVGMLVEAMFLYFITAAFFEFVIFSFFEMRLLLDIWKARRPEGFNQGWDAMRREFTMLYHRFYGVLLLGLLVIYPLRSYFVYFLFILYAFWIPQIVHNAMHDITKALSPRYVIGMSGTRLLIPLYVYGCPESFMPAPQNVPASIALVIWVALQVAVLLLQDRFGARFFIPARFLPPKFNYHQISLVDRDVDLSDPCPICYGDFDEHADPQDIMTTPCSHTFHSECLTRWMDQKMECPTCRGPLPPL